MLKLKYITIVSILFMFLIADQGEAAVAVGKTAPNPSPSQTKFLKVVCTVAKIKDNVLYLESGKKYKLDKVKISYSKGKAISAKKKMAEMVFVNGVLKEVFVR